MTTKIHTSEGGEVEVYGDITREGEAVAIIHVDCVLQFSGEEIDIPGARFKVPHGTEVSVRANTQLTKRQAVQLAVALLHETRDPTEEEIARARE